MSFTSRNQEGDAQFAPGTVIAGRYRIGSLLGSGGMGEVYRADDTKLGQTVALKFLPARLARDANLLAHLHDEVRLGRQVTHPNVCRIYDIVDWMGAHFVAMEYVDGEDLSRLLRRIGRITHDKAVYISRGVAAGLMAAHAKGILHRDLKPANVMIDSSGDARIMDFGIALPAGEDDGAIAGTLAYMAPELFTGQTASVQSDLYSLGLVMYELFTGQHAHSASSLQERVGGLNSPIPTPSSVIHDIDPAVEKVILRCLDDDPSQRPPTARQVVDALGGDPLTAAIAAGETPSPRVVAAGGTEGRLQPRVARSLLAAALFLLAFLVAWTAIGGFLRKSGLDRRPPEVLAEHAEEILRRLGIPAQELRSFGLDQKRAHFDWIATKVSAPRRWESVGRGLPLVTFWMRETSQPLLDTDVGHSPDPKIDMPPQTEPGATTIEIEPRGRLISLSAIASPEWKPRPLDWNDLLSAAGLAEARLTPAEPRMLPPSPADARAAWSGKHPQDGTAIRRGAAAWRGVPLFFRIIAPWDEADTTGARGRTRLALFISSFVLAAVAIGALLAWQNLRRRRGDKPGAFRVASMLFVLAFVATAARAEHYLSLLHELKVAQLALGTALLVGGSYWLVYIGLEPHVRRRWPEGLISWTRLTAGNWRNPMVGRDVLIGIVAGLAHVSLSSRDGIAELLRGNGFRTLAPRIQLLARGSLGISDLAASLQEGIIRGLTFMVVLMVLTILLRRRALAVAGTWLVLFTGFLFYSTRLETLPFFAIITTMSIFVVARYGLLASASMQAVYAAMVLYPLPDAAAWYTARGLIAPAVIVVVAVWAFRTSLGDGSDLWGRPASSQRTALLRR